MKAFLLAIVFTLISVVPALTETVIKTVTYTVGDKNFEGIVIYDDSSSISRPGVLMVPNWMGPSEQSLPVILFI